MTERFKARTPAPGVDQSMRSDTYVPAKGSLEALAANRIAIEAVTPAVDGGRFPLKRVQGDTVRFEADIFADGHDMLGAALRYRHTSAPVWRETPLKHFDNDRWAGRLTFDRIGRYEIIVEAWRDPIASWRSSVQKKLAAGQNISVDLAIGLGLLRRAAETMSGGLKDKLLRLCAETEAARSDTTRANLLTGEIAEALTEPGVLRENLTRSAQTFEVVADRRLAACAAWYELLPRSQSGNTERHGNFDDVIARLPYIRDLGFDVLYFPPIHPIGTTNRKGPNNALKAGPGDPGSPYAIGSAEGGHDAIHPELGDFKDFARLVAAAREHDLEIALDFAVQFSPDHPWIKEHPEWFDWCPDGTIQFAENPPKKYEDIVPPHFYGEAFPGLWYALRDLVLFWAEKGVKIFRVDNPHTKPFPFWEWMIREVQDRHPDAIFLSEAFTRPKVMKRLAKLGFTQSYSYFTWRNTKWELIDYLTELTQSDAREYMRPNFFANTPDINPFYLQTGGRPGFQVRLILAATLSPLYGIYSGYELCETEAVPGKEEYLHSEKYELKTRDWDREGNIKDDIRTINRIRREQPALQELDNLTFLNIWNDNLLCYYKRTPDNLIVVAVNLDPHHSQEADFEVPLWKFGLPDHASIQAVDLINGNRFTWHGKIQHLRLDPQHRPYAIWRLIAPGTS
jgi:starch synthase (maltosyl-transferring)